METDLKIGNTTFEFGYDNGLPYKPMIRPEFTFGDMVDNNSITIIKVLLDDESLINIKTDRINCETYHIINSSNEIWFDLQTVYLVINLTEKLKKRSQQKKIRLYFLNKNKLINGVGFDD